VLVLSLLHWVSTPISLPHSVLGSTVPVFTTVAAGVYGMLAFAESKIVNEIRVVEEGDTKASLESLLVLQLSYEVSLASHFSF
jgi:hypothetical protein